MLKDLIGPTHKWPNTIRKTFLSKKHMTNPERFKVTIFFLNNGVNPVLIKECYKIMFKFDRSANTQIDYLIKKYPSSKWKAWNVHLNKST